MQFPLKKKEREKEMKWREKERFCFSKFHEKSDI